MIVATIWGSMSDDNSYNSEHSIKARALEKKREDAADFYDEVAGRDNGKTARFLNKEERDRRTGKSTDRKTQLSALDILMMDQTYASTYKRVMDLLAGAEQEAQTAIDEAEEKLSQTRDDLSRLQNRANTLPDGTRVYQDKNGNVFTEDGNQLQEPEAEAIVWKTGSPSYDDYLNHKKAVSDWQVYLDDLRTYQTDVLGSARDRISDPDTPPSQEELEKIENDITSRNPVSAKPRTDLEETTERDTQPSSDISVPSL